MVSRHARALSAGVLVMTVSVCSGLLLALVACGRPAAPEPAAVPPAVPRFVPGELDPGVDPGDDFFAYVNGRWLARTEIPPDRDHVGTFPSLRETTQGQLRRIVEAAAAADSAAGSAAQKIGDLYRSFMDIDGRNAAGTAPLEPELKLIAGIRDLEDLSRYFARANTFGLSMPIDIDQSIDWHEPSRYTMVVLQGGLGLPDRDYYIASNPAMAEVRRKYVAHIESMFRLAGLDAAAAAAPAIVDLETRLAVAHMPRESLRQRAQNFRAVGRDALAGLMPGFAWDAFLAGYGVADAETLVLYTRDYLAALDAILTGTQLETWKAYLAWKTLNANAALLTSDLDALNFEFYGRVLSGTAAQRPLWRRGINVVNSALGELVGRAYVEEHFPPESGRRARELVDNLVSAYTVSIGELDWMTDRTRSEALAKLERIRAKVAYPDAWRDYAVDIRPDDLPGNLKRAALAEHRREIDRHDGPVDRAAWNALPQTVNTYYSPAQNDIVVPAAILQPPFFDPAADDALNYGAIGALIGHEIGHAFDDQGSAFDGDGRLRDWWTEADRQEFERRTAGLVAQYDAYRPFPDLGVNGEFTLGENVGDLGGISIALAAYRLSLAGSEAPLIDGLTGEQRLFIGFARMWRHKYRDAHLRNLLLTDPHAPARYRTNGALRNVPAFYEAFAVTTGDALYLPPGERVRIW
jgi:putative endopeptidase